MARARRPTTASQPELLARLHNIKEDPEEDAPRLALADWLQERGDPRGEFIRAQVEATRLLNQEDPWYASMRWDKAPSMEVGYARQWGEGASPEARARWDRAIALLARAVAVRATRGRVPGRACPGRRDPAARSATAAR